MFDINDLPWDLGKLGIVREAELVRPGVYEAVLEQELCLAEEVFLVHRSAAGISASAKRYGQPVDNYPDYLNPGRAAHGARGPGCADERDLDLLS